MATDDGIRLAKNRWANRRRRLIGYGQWQPFTDAEPVRQHVLAIQASGMGLRPLARHTGVSVGSLDHLIYGSCPHPPAAKIRTETAEALLAYWPTLDDYVDESLVDATGTRRRLQALATLGWTNNAIHQRLRHLGVTSVKTIEVARVGDGRVTARLARAVRDFYAWAAKTPAEATGTEAWIAQRSRNLAAHRGWHGPLDWDDIDDPNCQPETAAPYKPAEKYRRDDDRLAEIEHLYLLGESPQQIAKQLGGNEKYISDRLADVIRERQRRAEENRRTAHPAEAERTAA